MVLWYSCASRTHTLEQSNGTAKTVFPWLFGTILAGSTLQPFLGAQLCHRCCVPLPVYRYSFRRPQEDDRLSQPHLVLIQQPTGLELRTLGSQDGHPNHKVMVLWYKPLISGVLKLKTSSGVKSGPRGGHSIGPRPPVHLKDIVSKIRNHDIITFGNISY